MTTVATVYGVEVRPQVGSVILPDNWRISHKLQPSAWDQAEFYLPTGYTAGITKIAVNITVTGRTWQRHSGDLWVRVRIEFVGDGEPSVFHKGWMLKE